MSFDQHAANIGTVVIAAGVVISALAWLVRRAVKRLERFIDDRLTDHNGVALSKRLNDHISDSEKQALIVDARVKRIEDKQVAHDEAIEMWRALQKIADARPPEPAT